jgi:hypothetical protein
VGLNPVNITIIHLGDLRARAATVETILDSLAAVGILLAYDRPDGRRWKKAGKV